MSSKLRIENLSHSMDDEDLDRLFAPYGTVSLAEVVIDVRTGLSTGAGLVEMESGVEAKAAIAGLHGVKCCGLVLTVAWSTTGEETAGGLPGMFTSMNTPAGAPLKVGPRPRLH